MPLAAFPKCFLDALCTTGALTVEEWVRMAATLGVDGLEFYMGFLQGRSEADLERLRALAGEHGLSIPMMCYSPDFTQPSAEARREEVARQRHAIRTTALLGGRYCRVLSGQRRPGVRRADGLRWAAACICEALPEAEAQGVVLILENHYKDGYWQYPEFAQRADAFLELVALVGEHPNFGVNYDPSNALVAGDDPYALLEALLGRVVTMHASDRWFEGGDLEALRALDAHPSAGYAPFLTHGVIGEGCIDYDRIFGLLRQADFTGWISIEDGQDPVVGMAHLEASVRFLRGKMARYGLP